MLWGDSRVAAGVGVTADVYTRIDKIEKLVDAIVIGQYTTKWDWHIELKQRKISGNDFRRVIIGH